MMSHAARKEKSQDRKSTRLNSSHTVIYTLSLHDALPISEKVNGTIGHCVEGMGLRLIDLAGNDVPRGQEGEIARSEEHTSELQSHRDLHSFPTRRSSDLGKSQRHHRSLRRRNGPALDRPGRE